MGWLFIYESIPKWKILAERVFLERTYILLHAQFSFEFIELYQCLNRCKCVDV